MEKAIICDLDGTLALLGGRNPFNPKSVESDLLNNPVANILHVYASQSQLPVEIIFVTGRFEKLKAQTETWLQKHNINKYQLYMRKNNDYRKDIILKKEI